jgi:hypothetical protein
MPATRKQSAPDPFNGVRVVRYDYHDALYHCAKRDMRLPTVDETEGRFVLCCSAVLADRVRVADLWPGSRSTLVLRRRNRRRRTR